MFLSAVMQKIYVHLFCVYGEIINAAYCNILPFAKPSQSAKWGAETCAKHKSTSPCLWAILVFDRITVLCNGHLNSNRGICLR